MCCADEPMAFEQVDHSLHVFLALRIQASIQRRFRRPAARCKNTFRKTVNNTTFVIQFVLKGCRHKARHITGGSCVG
jgi:hypothetical protein